MAHTDYPPLRSARPDATVELMDRTGLDEPCLTRLGGRFYERVRIDLILGPIFSERIVKSLHSASEFSRRDPATLPLPTKPTDMATLHSARMRQSLCNEGTDRDQPQP